MCVPLLSQCTTLLNTVGQDEAPVYPIARSSCPLFIYKYLPLYR